jgi:hypothetical protein
MPRESFERQKLRTYRSVLSNVGEPVSVASAANPNVWRGLTASITPEQRRDEQGQTLDLPERIEVFVLRDEDDADYSGINAMVYGMLLKRTAANDPQPGRPFVFNGEFLEQGQHYFRAIFERPKRVARGR